MTTNEELNKYSLADLRQLHFKVVEMIRLKSSIEARLNADNLEAGMTVRYKGTSSKIKDEKFLLEKINKKNGVCKSLITGVRWNINLANIEMVQETA